MIQRQEILICDVEQCDNKHTNVVQKNRPIEFPLGWLVFCDHAVLDEDPARYVVICPRHNVKLRGRG